MDDITNEDRAEWALGAVKAFAARTGQDDGRELTAIDLQDDDLAREIVGDLICDLLHLLGSALFEKALEAGRSHYGDELCQFCGGTAEDHGVCDDCGPDRCSRCSQLITTDACVPSGHTPWMDREES